MRCILFSNVCLWWVRHLTQVPRRQGRSTGALLWNYAHWSDGVCSSRRSCQRVVSEIMEPVYDHCCRARSHAHSGVERVVCQFAFVRRAFFLQDETVARRLFPWLHVKPSTPVAASPVVLMCNTKGKGSDGPIVATGVSREGYQPSAPVLRWAASTMIPLSQQVTDSRSNS